MTIVNDFEADCVMLKSLKIAGRSAECMVYPISDIYTDGGTEQRCGKKKRWEDMLNTYDGKDETSCTDPHKW